MRAKITEAEFTRQVIALAKLRGWRTAHFRPALTASGRWVTAVQGDGKGFPDLVLVRDRVIFAELKVGKNPTSDEQDAWLAAIVVAGCQAVIWRPEDWSVIDNTLSEGR